MPLEVNGLFLSWSFGSSGLILVAAAGIYLRGWLKGRKFLASQQDSQRLLSFCAGLLALYLAVGSPLDALDSIFLSAHMAQHLLLLMVAPPLLLLGHPLLPLLRGLPKAFVKQGLGPYLVWPELRRVLRWMVTPPVAWAVFAGSTILWHLPRFYELALSSTLWHGTQHAFFFWSGILFWWPVIQPEPYRSKWPQWVAIPYLLFADLVNTALSAVFVFSGRTLYPTYAAMHGNGAAAQDDQTIAGLIMWVPGSIIYLVPAFLLVMRVVAGKQADKSSTRVPSLHRIVPAPKRHRYLARWRWSLQATMFLLAAIVMVDGWFGPRIAPLNLAGVLPWIHWRALSVGALLIIGNLFCMACPFTLFRDLGRRVFRPRRRWPSFLRNKWLASTLLLVYFWAYEAFSLWDKPFLTAWLIAGYFLAALIVDNIYRDASFCKYICPIGQFNFLTSLLSPREVAVKQPSTCQSCRTYDCIRGNEHARGCELYLFQPKKVGNLDCTFCLDCVNACPHDNVALLSSIPGKTITEDPYRSSIGRLSKRTDLAVLAIIFVFGAFANAAGMVAPVMMWEHKWHVRLGPHAMPFIVGAFTLATVVLCPAVLVALCAAGNLALRLQLEIGSLARRLIFTLVPLGVAMWSAHLLYHFATSWSAIIPVAARIFSTDAGASAMVVPTWITPAQILLLNVGLLFTLYIAWAIVRQSGRATRTAFGLLSPWAAISIGLYLAGVWTLFQPMQMRGMMQ